MNKHINKQINFFKFNLQTRNSQRLIANRTIEQVYSHTIKSHKYGPFLESDKQ